MDDYIESLDAEKDAEELHHEGDVPAASSMTTKRSSKEGKMLVPKNPKSQICSICS